MKSLGVVETFLSWGQRKSSASRNLWVTHHYDFIGDKLIIGKNAVVGFAHRRDAKPHPHPD